MHLGKHFSHKQIRAWRAWLIQQTGAHTRMLFMILMLLTFDLSLIHYIFEVVLQGSSQGYFRTLADIGILLLSGFDVAPPTTAVGWITAFLLLITNILFIGTIIQGIGEIIIKAKGRRISGMSDATLTGHTIIFGFSHHSRAIIDLYLENTEKYQTHMVLVDEHLEALPAVYAAEPDWIEFVRGNPFDQATLERANLASAKTAIICPRDDGLASEADSYAILISLAVERCNPDVLTTLILRDRNSRVFLEKNTANGKISVEVDQVICPDEIVENLTANAALNPGLASFILDVVSYEEKGEDRSEEFSDDSIIVVEAPPADLFVENGWQNREIAFPELVGRYMEKTGGLVLGIQDEAGQKVLPQAPFTLKDKQVLVLKKE